MFAHFIDSVGKEWVDMVFVKGLVVNVCSLGLGLNSVDKGR